MGRLDPKLDVVFKLLLTREPALLVDMISGVLGRPVRDLTILDPVLLGQQARDKQVLFDIHVLLDDGARVDVEMQRRVSSILGPRLIYYTARDYSGQLDRGDSYHLLTPTVGIAWLAEPLVLTTDRLHLIYELRERVEHDRLSDHIAIHLLQLSSLRSSNPRGGRASSSVERWARFLMAHDDADFDQLASEDPIMLLAHQTLEHLSMDPQAQRLARAREDELRFLQMDLLNSRAEGEALGRAEGEALGRAEGEALGRARAKAEVLLKLLGQRFGDLPVSMRREVEGAEPARLDAWIERVLTAECLHEVFAR